MPVPQKDNRCEAGKLENILEVGGKMALICVGIFVLGEDLCKAAQYWISWNSVEVITIWIFTEFLELSENQRNDDGRVLVPTEL